MTTEENKKLILDHYESSVHQQDTKAVRRQLAADFRDHEMPPGTAPGPEAAHLRVKIEDIVAEGDRVAVRASWTGTHRGPLTMMPVPVTNRTFTFTGMVFWRICDGKIAERWAIIDRLGLQQQLTTKS
jgi:predicted ester cyclase